MLKITSVKCNGLGLIFMSNLFIKEFERVIHNTVHEMFLLLKIIYCKLHLSQSW